MNSERTDLRPSDAMQLTSRHAAMVQFTPHTHSLCHLSRCPTTLQVQHMHSHTQVMLLCIYTRITYLSTTDTKRDKFKTPVSKIKIESNLPKAILLPYPFKARNTSKLHIQIQFLPCSPS